MRGISVRLHVLTKTGEDAFHCSTYTESIETVENVLVAPATEGGMEGGEETLNTTNLTGSRAAYVLAIPKGDTHTWEGNLVEFFGETWRVIGRPTEGISALIPGPWNKKVRVESIVGKDQAGT